MIAKKTALLFLVILLHALSVLSAEELYSPKWGYALDLPEGFSLVSEQNGDRYQFEHSLVPVSFVIASYPLDRYANPEEALKNVYKSLQLTGDTVDVTWDNRDNIIGTFSMKSGSVSYTGWAISVSLLENKGTTVMLAYAPSEQFSQVEQIIVSALDSVTLGTAGSYVPGIFVEYAFPKEGDVSVSATIGETQISSVVDKSDADAASFVVDREYAVLVFFANTPLWKESWQRFYRIIYKDSYSRLERFSHAAYDALFPKIMQADSENTDLSLVQALLTWSQEFPYERIPLGTDFTPLPAILQGSGSDCDSRALLLAVLLSHMQYKTMLFVSREYSHALFGIAIDGQGARLEEGGIQYLLGETTAPVSIGLVPQDMSESTKWIGIEGL